MKSNSTLDKTLSRLQQARQDVEDEIERLLEKQRKQFQYSIRRGKVVFDRRVRNFHKQQRTNSFNYILRAPLVALLSAPLIYGMIVPLALLDVTISTYQSICFRVYKIPRVVRSEYIVIDRHRLPYLNTIQKLNCVYCGYGNGLIAYAREIVARTEQYWCPIKHATRPKGSHDREAKFFVYGDVEEWSSDVQKIRCDWDESNIEAKAPPSSDG